MSLLLNCQGLNIKASSCCWRHFFQSLLSAHSFPSLLLSVSDGLTVVLVGRMHPIIVKLPPLLGALSGPLVLFWEIMRIFFSSWMSQLNDWTRPSHLHQKSSGFAYHRAPLQRSFQTRSSSPRGTLAFAHLLPESASARLQEWRKMNSLWTDEHLKKDFKIHIYMWTGGLNLTKTHANCSSLNRELCLCL